MFPCFSLKREMRVVGEDCGLQPVTIAMAFVYFEKLVLQGRLNKQNRYAGGPSEPDANKTGPTGLYQSYNRSCWVTETWRRCNSDASVQRLSELSAALSVGPLDGGRP